MLVHGFGKVDGVEFATQSDSYAAFKEWGLPTSDQVKIFNKVGEIKNILMDILIIVTICNMRLMAL